MRPAFESAQYLLRRFLIAASYEETWLTRWRSQTESRTLTQVSSDGQQRRRLTHIFHSACVRLTGHTDPQV